jgi:spermidine/putrescine transport system ATP-binding protein
MSVAKNVGYFLHTRGVAREKIAVRVEDALALVRLPGMAERMPSQLSGGQAQRVALARALIGEPSVLLLDEPLAALDLKLRKEMQLELRRIQRTLGRTFLYVTHDQEEALVMSDRIVVMSDGRFVEDGTPQQVYSRPTSLFASGFIGEANQLAGELTAVEGTIGRVVLDGGLATSGTLTAGPMTEGSPVMITLRPEHVAIARGRTTRLDGYVASPALVLESVYVGSRTRVKSRIPNGMELWAEIAPSSAPSPGEDVELSWSESDALILAR